MKIYPILIFLSVSNLFIKAENRSITDTLFRPNHYSFDFTFTFYPAPEIITSYNLGVTFRPSVFASAGFTYSHFWKNGFGLTVGGRWGIIPFGIAESGEPFTQFNSYNYLQFPICGAYQIHFKKSFNLSFSSGIAVDIMFYPYQNPSLFALDYSEVDFFRKSDLVYLDIPFEITASKVFRRKHELDFGLSYLMPFRTVGWGQFINNNTSLGTFEVRNEYIGIKVGYTFLGKALFKRQKRIVKNG